MLGKSWVTENVVMYTLEGIPTGNPFDIAFEVFVEEDLTVPAGTFYSYGIGGVAPPPGLSESLTLLGRHVEAGSRDEASEWFSDSIGLTQYLHFAIPEGFQLIDYTLPATPVDPRRPGDLGTDQGALQPVAMAPLRIGTCTGKYPSWAFSVRRCSNASISTARRYQVRENSSPGSGPSAPVC